MTIRDSNKFFIVQIGMLLLIYYSLTTLFVFTRIYSYEYIVLNQRLGTILYHSVVNNKRQENLVEHIYCYYPRYPVNFDGEYFLKKVESIDDCRNWLGILIRYEYEWMSEQNMLAKPSI